MKMKPHVTRTLAIYRFVFECCDHLLVLCLVTTIFFSFALVTTILFCMYWNVFVFRSHL